MKHLCSIFTTIVLLASTGAAYAQGFINLNFESATPTTDSSQGVPFVYASSAIPGWTAYVDGAAQTSIVYNFVTTGAASVDLEGTNSGFNPIQGNYFILLQASSGGGTPIGAAIGQTAQIPLSAMSFIFWGRLGPSDDQASVSFNGNLLQLFQIGSTANYNIFDADVSPYAGQTGQLLFQTGNLFSTAGQEGSMRIDNIQFSNSPVPEPGPLALAAVGATLLGLRRRRNSLG